MGHDLYIVFIWLVIFFYLYEIFIYLFVFFLSGSFVCKRNNNIKKHPHYHSPDSIGVLEKLNMNKHIQMLYISVITTWTVIY